MLSALILEMMSPHLVCSYRETPMSSWQETVTWLLLIAKRYNMGGIIRSSDGIKQFDSYSFSYSDISECSQR